MELFILILLFINTSLLFYYMLGIVPRLNSEKQYELRMKEIFNEFYNQQIKETAYWRNIVVKDILPAGLDFPPMDENPAE